MPCDSRMQARRRRATAAGRPLLQAPHAPQYTTCLLYSAAAKRRGMKRWVMVGGKLQHVAQPCLVHSQRSFADADPLRRGSLFCHHHRKRCEGWVRAGERCRLSSSSEHVHAEPLKHGERFCAHHADHDCKRRCDACWQVVASEAGLADTDARVPGPVKPWYCDACWDEWEAWPDRCGVRREDTALTRRVRRREYCEAARYERCAQRHAYCCCRMPPAA